MPPTDEIMVNEAHAKGMGDQAILTGLPLLGDLTGAEVRLSTKCSPKNSEVFELFWRKNHYVEDYVDEPGTVGIKGRVAEYGTLARKHGSMRAIAMMNGFSARLTSQIPVLYYTPRMLKNFKDAVVADPTSDCQQIPAAKFHQAEEYIGRDYYFTQKDICYLTSDHMGQYGQDTIGKSSTYKVRDIFEWADILFSARVVLCTEAGAHHVAAAYRQNRPTFSINSNKGFNERLFVYPGVTYVPVSCGEDFHSGHY